MRPSPRWTALLRHASAKKTLDTYGHLRPDRDESTRAAVEQVFANRADFLRTKAGRRSVPQVSGLRRPHVVVQLAAVQVELFLRVYVPGASYCTRSLAARSISSGVISATVRLTTMPLAATDIAVAAAATLSGKS